MKKFIGGLAALALVAGFFTVNSAGAAEPTWDTTGSYNIAMTCVVGCEGTYEHDLNLTQDGDGNLTGDGGYPADGTHTYHWVINSGTVSDNVIDLTATYDLGAVGTVLELDGTVGTDGTLSGTWSDNFGGTRSGTWLSTSGTATEIDDTEEPLSFTVNPWVYDESDNGSGFAAWTVLGANPTYPTTKEACKKDGWKNSSYLPAFKNQGQCVSYVDNTFGDAANYVLSLQKNAATSELVAAGADISGEEGITLTSLGFDYKTGTYCGAGAPRFNVYTSDTNYYFFGCEYGTHTDLGNGWTRVTFTDSDAVAAGSEPFPGFGDTTVTDIEIVMDEQGQTVLDNIMINGIVVGQ